MSTKRDFVLKSLVEKKKELVQQLLRETQNYIIEQDENRSIRILDSRNQIVENLKRNDRCIVTREQEIGRIAKIEESELYEDIRFLVQTISENNEATLGRMELERQALDLEKKKLEQGNKVSGYLQQKGNLGNFRSKPGSSNLTLNRFGKGVSSYVI